MNINSFVSNLFSDDFELIFLANRWFNSTGLMKHIDSLGHTYVLRMKQNIKVFYFDKNKGPMFGKFYKTCLDTNIVLSNTKKFKLQTLNILIIL